jgi:tryptophan synthase alpha chain
MPFAGRPEQAGVSGIILPDLPLAEYKEQYQHIFQAHDLHFIFLITPTTKPERIREIDHASSAFIYAVSASATTGTGSPQAADGVRGHKIDYLKRIASMKLDHPVIVGFGIHDHDTLKDAWEWASGAIVGTAYLQELGQADHEREAIKTLLEKLGGRAS